MPFTSPGIKQGMHVNCCLFLGTNVYETGLPVSGSQMHALTFPWQITDSRENILIGNITKETLAVTHSFKNFQV